MFYYSSHKQKSKCEVSRHLVNDKHNCNGKTFIIIVKKIIYITFYYNFYLYKGHGNYTKQNFRQFCFVEGDQCVITDLFCHKTLPGGTLPGATNMKHTYTVRCCYL